MSKEKKKTSRDKLLDVTFDEVYIYGYCGASTATILKKAGVPRGSMYHHFESKKALVLAMIEERLVPKVREFFEYELTTDMPAMRIVEYAMKKISRNKMLIKHGCPLHRLMFEMGGLDKDIALACEVEFEHLAENFEKVLSYGQQRGEIRGGDTRVMSEVFIMTTWGILSRTPESSSDALFLRDMESVMAGLQA
jgi:TetR/AcrR family transcriptional repressor of nem operon